ncbi:MAG: ribonuclease Z [Elusimicrobiota bacterium]|nr:ribonuclease Z [Elusimicrobiota bacterium]
MKIIFLGTNGWYDTGTGSTVCSLIRTKRWDIVLDAGNGIYKLDSYCDGTKPVFILLSHFHIDHIAGLHMLLKFRFKKGLTICGHKGARRLLNTFAARPFTVPFKKLPYAVKVLELPAQAGELPFKITTLPLVHADPVLGMRLELEGKTVTYCTDTGSCPNALTLAKGADLLITECAHAPGESNPAWPHLNPETAAGLAAAAGAKRLALTHFSADRYRTAAARAAGLRLARKVFPLTTAARDELSLTL